MSDYPSTCVVCRTGHISPGVTNHVSDRGGRTLIIRDVPAGICDTCGEPCFEESVARRLAELAKDLERLGLEVAVRQYAA